MMSFGEIIFSKFDLKIYNFDLHDEFFMEKMAQISHISKKVFKNPNCQI
jgi:hypothetical protein